MQYSSSLFGLAHPPAESATVNRQPSGLAGFLVDGDVDLGAERARVRIEANGTNGQDHAASARAQCLQVETDMVHGGVLYFFRNIKARKNALYFVQVRMTGTA